MPGEELPVARQCRTSPLYDKLKAKGAVYTETYGWERPKWYSLDGREEQYSYRHNNVFDVVRNECMAVRERVGIGGSYLTQRETRDFTRREYVPMWPSAGQDVLQIARAEALEILHNHKPPPLPEIGIDACDLGTRARRNVAHAPAEHAVYTDDDLVAGFEQVDETRLHSGAAGGRQGQGECVLSAKHHP